MNSPSNLLVRFLDYLRVASQLGPVLDLACGEGRNGFYLKRENIPTIFADKNRTSLDDIEMSLVMEMLFEGDEIWHVDLEDEAFSGLPEQQYGAVVVFRYLHRPLFDQIKASVKPGGLIMYETFTVDHARFGRPTNPDFLLVPNELRETFSDWDILHSFEGEVDSSNKVTRQAIAQIVARKPV